MEWFKKVVFENYANFSGRARRKEFWMFWFMYWGILTIGAILIPILDNSSEIISSLMEWLLIVWFWALILPFIAIFVRRLHDTGRSGWWLGLTIIYTFGLVAINLLVIEKVFKVDSDLLKYFDWAFYWGGVMYLILFICTLLNSEPKANKWGQNLKGEGNYPDMPPAL